MNEDETFFEFYVELSDIVNLCFNLGEKNISNSKVIRKSWSDIKKKNKNKNAYAPTYKIT